MKTYEFRYLNRDGQTIYETLELPDDAALMIGYDKYNREVYEGDGVFAPDNFIAGTATIGIKSRVNQFSLADDARSHRENIKLFGRKEYFYGDPFKEEPPPAVKYAYLEE